MVDLASWNRSPSFRLTSARFQPQATKLVALRSKDRQITNVTIEPIKQCVQGLSIIRFSSTLRATKELAKVETEENVQLSRVRLKKFPSSYAFIGYEQRW